MAYLITLLSLAFILVVYFLIYRPWQVRWGATDEELKSKFPGDEIVQKPDFRATRGISIRTGPEKIWPWIIQIGSLRAGWYSINLLDNANKPSSEVILPEWQKIENDYFIPFTPDQKNGMWVKEFKANEYILWWDHKGKATWLWYLVPVNDGKTRLITRLHTKYDFSFPWILFYTIGDMGDIVMMSKCLRGIKRRAEALAS